MPVLVNCKFDENRNKTEGVSVETCFMLPFRHSRASNTEMNGPIQPAIELIRDFMPGLVINKFDEDRINTEDIHVETSFSAKFSSLKRK